MKKFIKFVFLLLVVGVVAGAIASYVSKKKFESMSDEEIRDFLATKLEGKVGDDQLNSIQDAVIAGVRANQGATDGAVDSVEDLAEDAQDAVEDATEAASDAAADAGDKAAAKAKDAGEKASQVIEAVVEVVEDAGDS